MNIKCIIPFNNRLFDYYKSISFEFLKILSKNIKVNEVFFINFEIHNKVFSKKEVKEINRYSSEYSKFSYKIRVYPNKNYN